MARYSHPTGGCNRSRSPRNTIVGLGARDELRPYFTDDTRVIDPQGKTVLPGFFDMHVHPTGAGLGEMQCRLPHGSTPEQIFSITEAYARTRRPGQWITGRACGSSANQPCGLLGRIYQKRRLTQISKHG